MKKTIISCIMIFLAMLTCAVYAEAEAAEVPILESKWETPSVHPPEGEHPRVYFRAEDIPRIKANTESAENRSARDLLMKYVETAVPASDGKYSADALRYIEAKAFYYALYGDEDRGREAVDGVLNSVRYQEDASEDYRRYGRMVAVTAQVYDWCHDLMSDAERDIFIAICADKAGHMEIGWPPSKEGALVGHGAELQLQADLMSFAIAAYDRRPDIWNYIGGRYYAEYVPTLSFVTASGFHNQGTYYGAYRRGCAAQGYMLITGMGAEPPIDTDKLVQMGYADIYTRRPDGFYLADGDKWYNATPPYKYSAYSDSTYGLLLMSAMGNDGYLRTEYFRQITNDNQGSLEYTYPNNSPILFLIYNNPSAEARSFDSLPLSRYFGTPSGIMAARTSWGDGAESSAVTAMMKVGEYQFNNHQHLDSGAFRLYYKGLLAGDGGYYASYGTDEHKMYSVKSVAHNVMLICDPDEQSTDSVTGLPEVAYKNVNDGGQKPPKNRGEFGTAKVFLDDPDTHVAKVTGHETDPKNTQEPNYTYLKGDLTNAYGGRAESYERSFMFLNLKDEETPAALIVFDRAVSSDAEFKKTWLLHTVGKPNYTDGDNTTVAEDTRQNGNTSYNGRLTLETLLPKSDNLSREVYGNEEDGWCTVNNYRYNTETKVWDVIQSTSYDQTLDTRGRESEENTYRLELSPKTPSKEDCFLNVMTVTDAGKEITEKAPLYEAEGFYGTEVKNRAVFFAKDASKPSGFEYTMPSDEAREFTICGMQSGKYTVTLDGTDKITAYVTEDGGVLSFDAACRVVAAMRVSGDVKEPSEAAEAAETRNTYSVRIDNTFVSPKGSVTASNGKYYLPLGGIAEAVGYKLKPCGTSETEYVLLDDTIAAAHITVGEKKIRTDRGIYEAAEAPYTDNGVLMLECDDLEKLLCVKSVKDDKSCTIYFTVYDRDDIYKSVSFSDGAAEVGAYLHFDNGIESVMCGVYNGTRLVDAQRMQCDSGGVYRAAFVGDTAEGMQSDKYKVKIFLWGDDLSPYKAAQNVDTKPADGFIKSYTAQNGGFKITNSNSNMTVSAADGVYILKKTGTAEEAAAVMKLYDDDGNLMNGFCRDNDAEDSVAIVHYSADVRILKKSVDEEYLQVRAVLSNESGNTKKVSFELPRGEGNEYRIDFIADLKEKEIKQYVNGRLYKTQDFSAYGDYKYFVGFYHYLQSGNKGYSGGEVMLRDCRVTVYGNAASVDKTAASIKNNVSY